MALPLFSCQKNNLAVWATRELQCNVKNQPDFIACLIYSLFLHLQAVKLESSPVSIIDVPAVLFFPEVYLR